MCSTFTGPGLVVGCFPVHIHPEEMSFLRYSLVVAVTAVVVVKMPGWLTPGLETNVRGWTATGWERVERTFRDLVESGAERGGSFSVYYRGERVVNLVGGYADQEAGLPWTENTVAQFFSTTKGVAAIVVAMLVDRGYLSYDKPVKDYWPEFAANGKDDVTVEQLFSHQAGLAIIDEPITTQDIIQNTDSVSRALANQKPAWKPGTKIGYHAISIGLYQDQVVRRVDPKHRSLSQFFKEELATPLGLDFQIGLPRQESWRAARVYPMNLFTWETLTHPETWRIFRVILDSEAMIPFNSIPVEYAKNMYNNPLTREAPIPSVNGVGTADSVAKLFGILANGGKYKGKTYLTPAGVRGINEVVITGTEIYLGIEMTVGRGTSLVPNQDNSSLTFGTPGAGGQMGYGDPKYRLGWAYLTNYHSAVMETPRYKALRKATYDTVFELEKKQGG